MAVRELLKAILPGHAAKLARREKNEKLDEELNETFPTSDTPAMVQPGSGITGAEVEPSELSPSQLAKGMKPPTRKGMKLN